eukprot:TRINITY_DN17096_c0_g1_i5.p1 TRINITY_DN17096_c0_g1~~TRINITY_DN17096_c0_g1_i5.p1  ORF type:complete len:249 (+),score=15.39 TRINITY_DN17096_c0_g1_i5:228-974(+)
MEAEIKPSVEYEDKIREQEELKRQKEQELERLKAAEEQQRLEQQRAKELQQHQLQLRQQEAHEKLLPEPDVSQQHVQCVFRLSSGDRVQRRFLKQSNVDQLFYFVDSIVLEVKGYRLVTQFPRRVVERGGVGSLESLGLSDQSYVFFFFFFFFFSDTRRNYTYQSHQNNGFYTIPMWKVHHVLLHSLLKSFHTTRNYTPVQQIHGFKNKAIPIHKVHHIHLHKLLSNDQTNKSHQHQKIHIITIIQFQ